MTKVQMHLGKSWNFEKGAVPLILSSDHPKIEENDIFCDKKRKVKFNLW